VLEEVLVGGASGLGVPELRPVVEVERARRAGVAPAARSRAVVVSAARSESAGVIPVVWKYSAASSAPVGSSAGVTVVIAASARS